jgi:hypothetical protein
MKLLLTLDPAAVEAEAVIGVAAVAAEAAVLITVVAEAVADMLTLVTTYPVAQYKQPVVVVHLTQMAIKVPIPE